MELLNIQEQVQKNKDDIKQLKNGIKIEFYCTSASDLNVITTEENVGKYALFEFGSNKNLLLITRKANGTITRVDLGTFPAVVQGQKGDKGDDGANGERGSNIYGVSINPPSDAKVGDYYIQKKIVDGATDYVMNKLDEGGTWRPQFSMRGPQGLPGVYEEIVIANPIDEPTDTLQKIDIHGIVYDFSTITPNPDQSVSHTGLETATINGTTYYIGGSWAKYLSPILYEEDQKIVADELIDATQGVLVPLVPSYNNDAASKQYVDNATKLESLVDESGNNRFVEETFEITPKTGQTITYAKWALSGMHLLIVICGETDENNTGSISYNTITLPDWIKAKITPIGGDNVLYAKMYTYNKSSTAVGSIDVVLTKSGSDVGLYHSTDIPSNSAFRLQIDLLIDNE